MHRLWLLAFASCTPLSMITVPQEAKGDVAVWFINDSKHDVCDVRMASATSSNIGYDWLSTAETMFPDGESHGVKVRPGPYKLLVKSCDQKFEAGSTSIDIQVPTVISFGGHNGIVQAALQTKP